MLFSSPVFLFIFLPFLLVLYFACPKRLRNALLLLASLLFYSWGEGRFALIMLGSIGMNYLLGLLLGPLQKDDGARKRKIILAVGVAFNLGLLVFFKYANFGMTTIVGEEALKASDFEAIHLPIGISFYTFQALSYLVDVYRGVTAPQRNPDKLGLYISFFPQLIAGPIIRYKDVARQLDKRQSSYYGFYYGAKRFTIGLAKKVLIANTLGAVADDIFKIPVEHLDAGLTWLGAICYTFQIYFDFSGYSDMAIGLGRIFGFKFMENFNFPYIADSIQSFWRRWHISLSNWFRDYLYVPLGGNRKGQGRTLLNLGLVFLLCGFWHGANWTFIVWGLYHGFFLIIERLGALKKVPFKPLHHIYTLFVVIIGWVLFKSETLEGAAHFLGAMFGLGEGTGTVHYAAYFLNYEVLMTLLLATVFCTPILREFKFKIGKPEVLRYAEGSLVIVGLIVSVMYLASDTYNPFLYFQF